MPRTPAAAGALWDAIAALADIPRASAYHDNVAASCDTYLDALDLYRADRGEHERRWVHLALSQLLRDAHALAELTPPFRQHIARQCRRIRATLPPDMLHEAPCAGPRLDLAWRTFT